MWSAAVHGVACPLISSQPHLVAGAKVLDAVEQFAILGQACRGFAVKLPMDVLDLCAWHSPGSRAAAAICWRPKQVHAACTTHSSLVAAVGQVASSRTGSWTGAPCRVNTQLVGWHQHVPTQLKFKVWAAGAVTSPRTRLDRCWCMAWRRSHRCCWWRQSGKMFGWTSVCTTGPQGNCCTLTC